MTVDPHKKTLDAILKRDDFELTGDLHFKTPESDEDKKLRLHKDKVSFYIKDMAAYVVAYVVIGAIFLYSLVVLWDKTTTKDDRQFAISVLMALLTGIVGLVFGKSMK